MKEHRGAALQGFFLFFFLNQMNFLIYLTAKRFLETQTGFTIINWCLTLTGYPIKKKKEVSLLQNELLQKVTAVAIVLNLL